MKLLIHDRTSSRRTNEWCSLWMRMSWSTVSKAADISSRLSSVTSPRISDYDQGSFLNPTMSTISSLSAVTDNLVMESGRIFPNIQYNTSFCRCGQILCQPCWPGRTVSGVRVLWVYQWKFTVNFCNRCTVGLIGWHYLKYWVFNNDCTPSTVETSKMLAKLLLYYNNLNKVTIPYCAKFQIDVDCLFFLNQELQISNPCGRQQQQQQHPACAGMTVAVQWIIHCHVQDRGELFASLTTKSGVNIAHDLHSTCDHRHDPW